MNVYVIAKHLSNNHNDNNNNNNNKQLEVDTQVTRQQ